MHITSSQYNGLIDTFIADVVNMGGSGGDDSTGRRLTPTQQRLCIAALTRAKLGEDLYDLDRSAGGDDNQTWHNFT